MSYVFHPVFIPLMGTSLYLYIYRDFFETRDIQIMLVRIAILTLLIPLVFLYFLKVIGKIDSMMIQKAEQRKMPLAFQVMLMSLLLLSVELYQSMPGLYLFFLGGMASTLIALGFLFLQKKVSLHMIGMGALTSFVMGISLETGENISYLIALLFVVCGAVASSRLLMKAHNYIELTLGFLTGLLPQLILWRFWL